MSEELLLNKSFVDIGDRCNSFFNTFKAEMLMKGYQLKKEKALKGKEVGNILTLAKKLEGFMPVQINVEIKRNHDDLLIMAYSSSKKDVSPIIIADIEKTCDKVQGKCSK
jgi:hypothetical protein